MPIANFLQTNGVSPLRVMCVGDSITVGYDATNNWLPEDGFRYRMWYLTRRGDGAIQMVGPNSAGGTYATWDPDHAGINGTTLVTMNSNVAAWIAAHTPDLVVVLGGINDIATGASAATALTRLDTLLATINATPTAPQVIVSTTTRHTTYAIICDTYNAGIAAICASRGAWFIDAASDVSAATALLSDLVHPSSRGYERIATRLSRAVLAYLDRKYLEWEMTASAGAESDIATSHDGTYQGTPTYNGDDVTFSSASSDGLHASHDVYVPTTYTVIIRGALDNEHNGIYWSLFNSGMNWNALYTPSGNLTFWDGSANIAFAGAFAPGAEDELAIRVTPTLVTCFRNGSQFGTAQAHTPRDLSSAGLSLMTDDAGTSQFQSGTIKRFKIHHRALSDTEIAAEAAA